MAWARYADSDLYKALAQTKTSWNLTHHLGLHYEDTKTPISSFAEVLQDEREIPLCVTRCKSLWEFLFKVQTSKWQQIATSLRLNDQDGEDVTLSPETIGGVIQLINNTNNNNNNKKEAMVAKRKRGQKKSEPRPRLTIEEAQKSSIGACHGNSLENSLTPTYGRFVFFFFFFFFFFFEFVRAR